MRNPPLLPHSFASALLGAFVLVLLPLAVALALAIVQLHGLAAASTDANARAAVQGAQARAASEALVGIERSLRQAQVLGTGAMRDAYRAQRDRLLAVLGELAARHPEVGAAADPDGQPLPLQAVRGAEAKVTDAFDEGRAAAALDEFDELQLHASAVVDAANRRRAEEQRQFAEMPARVSATLLALAAAAVLLAVLLASLFAWRLGRPVRLLGDAMRRLGEGDLDTAVAVTGPSDIVRLGERLEWLRARLASLEQTRSRFLRSMSHDLKTPIAAIAEGAASLDEQLYGPLTPPQRSVVGVIRHNTERLLSRIESLLRVDRPQPPGAAGAAGAHPAAVARVDLVQVVRAVLDDHALALRHRRLQCRERLPAQALVVGDAEGLRVVVDNLLSNAIKFSPPGGNIELRMEARDDELQLSVIDDGPGVAPGEEERIFDPAVRGSAARASGAPGSGHGLAIARDIAQAHGGRLRVDAVRRAGARFDLRLPRLLEVEDHAHA